MPDHPIVHIELSASDPEVGARFYSEVFGWQMDRSDVPVPYIQWRPQSGPGGGFSQVDGELTKAGDVLVYVGTDDIDASLAKIEAAGGRVVMPKTEIPTIGWFALFDDPSGNRLALYTAMRPMG